MLSHQLLGKSLVWVLAIASWTLLTNAAASADTITWNGEGDATSWHDPDNWDLDRMPQDGDDVVIPDVAVTTEVLFSSASGDIAINSLICAEAFRQTGDTLSIAATSVISNDYTLSGGTLTGAGKVSVTGMLTWSGGYMAGAGVTNADGGLTIDGTAYLYGDGDPGTDDRILNNNTNTPGAVFSGSGRVYMYHDVVFNNSGFFDIQTDRAMSRQAGEPQFSNSGTLVKSAGDGRSEISVILDNTGTVEVQTGTLELSRGGSHSGDFSGDGTLEFGGGTHILETTSSVTVSNVIFSGSGTTDVHGSYDLAGSSTTVANGTNTFHADAAVGGVGDTLTITSGTVDFSSGEPINVTEYTQTGGTLTGSDTVNVSGMLIWSGGYMKGSGITSADGGLTIDRTVYLSGDGDAGTTDRVLNNNTDVPGCVFSGSGWLYMYYDVVFNNVGTFDVQADRGMSRQAGEPQFSNSGTLVKSAGDGRSEFSIAFDNTGTVEVQTGTLELSRGGSHSGDFSGTGTLEFGGGTHTLETASSVTVSNVIFSGSGTTDVHGSYDLAGSSTTVANGTNTFHADAAVVGVGDTLTITNGTVDFSSGELINVAEYTQTGGTLTGSDTVNVSGMLTWSGGYMKGSGITNADGGLTIDGTVYLYGDGDAGTDDRILNNNTNAPGAILSGNGRVQMYHDVVFHNSGVFDIQTDRNMSRQGGEPQFSNSGTLVKSAGDGRSEFSIIFDNAGTVEVQTGTLELSRGGSHSGDFSGTGTLELGGGTHTLETASSVTVSDVVFSGNVVTDIHGTYDLAGSSTTVSSGTNTFYADAAVGSVGDTLTITNGIVDFSSGELINVPECTQTGGTLTGSDTVNVSGMLTWSGGWMMGSGVTNANGGLIIDSWVYLSGDGDVGTTDRVVNNNTDVPGCVFSGSGWLYMYHDVVFNNNGTFDVQADRGIHRQTGDPQFNNNGAFLKSGNVGLTEVRVAFHNNGLAEVRSGTLEFSGGGTHTGDFSGDGTLEFGGGTHILEAGSSVTVSDVVFSGSVVTDIHGTYGLAGSSTTVHGGTQTFYSDAVVGSVGYILTVSGGTLDLSSQEPINVGEYIQYGGTLTGSDTLTVSELLYWSAGYMTGSGITNADGELIIAGGVYLQGDGDPGTPDRVFNNNGNDPGATLIGNANLYMYNDTVLNNDGTLDVRADATIGWTGDAVFNNNGVFIKSAGAGTTSIRADFANSGTVEVSAGRLKLHGAFSNFTDTRLTGGTYIVSRTFEFPDADIVTNEATILLDGTTAQIVNQSDSDALTNLVTNTVGAALTVTNGRDLTTPAAFDNAGDVTVGPGSTLTISGDYTQTSGSTTLDGGTLDVTDLVDIQAGSLAGWGTVDGHVTNNGTVAPGLSAGQLDVTGDYVQTASATLNVEIGGDTPGSGYDVLAVAGSATLDGTLLATLIGGYVPPVGTEFDILTANPVNGVFAFDNLPLVFGGNCKGADYRDNSVTLVTLAGKIITQQPASQKICEGGPVTFSVTATGEPSLSYQWRKNGGDISGANGDSFTIDSATTADAGSYDVVITNICGFEISDPAILTVNTAPTIITQPDSIVVCEGEEATFTVDVDGVPAPSFQWRHDGDEILGANDATYVIGAVTTADAGGYDVVVTNPCGLVTSDVATLSVDVAPSITVHPLSQTVCEDGAVTFTVTADSTPAPSYQWRKNGVDMPGATDSSYIIDPVTTADAGDYDVVITNVCGSVTSDAATLTVNVAPSITTHPVSETVCEDGAVTFTVTADGTPAPTYQWRKDGEEIPGATDSFYTIDPVATDDAGDYDVVVTNVCGSVTSSVATLTVNVPVSITLQPVSQAICEGDYATFSAEAEGVPAPTYQWRKEGADIPGATGSFYTIGSVTGGDAGDYDVAATNTCGSVISDTATLTVLVSPLGDLDTDCDVDLGDFDLFVQCLAGPGGGVLGHCNDADLDGNGDVDLRDFALFQSAFSPVP